MGERIISGLVVAVTAIVGVAIIATLVSKNANTAGVLKAATSGFATDLSAALAPVTGGAGFGGVQPITIS